VSIAAEVRPARWGTYVRHAGLELEQHWSERLTSGAQVALLCGVGFDPRMCLGLELLHRAGAGAPNCQVYPIAFPAPGDELAAAAAEVNRQRFGELTDGWAVSEIPVPGSPEIEQVARASAALVEDLDRFGNATDLVVDVNAMPRSVFMPLISKLLFLCDARMADAPNLHVIAGDAAWLDALIAVEGLDEDASWLYPYAGTFMSETDSQVPRVWMPALGENTSLALSRIYATVGAEELCPLLPFPARDPRRGDRLFAEHHELLFDRLQADSGTVIYADEANPFQVYRHLRRSTQYYADTLGPLGGCKVAYSALSSKLIALGVLLVAYELRDPQVPLEAGIVDIGAQQYLLERSVAAAEARARTELVELTLSGDCYL
jgi:hypothetical protein